MKVITIKQPFATLIAEGLKEYEFRTWKTSYRGEILIHAGKGVDKKAMERFKYLNLDTIPSHILSSIYQDLRSSIKATNSLLKNGVIHKLPKFKYKISSLYSLKNLILKVLEKSLGLLLPISLISTWSISR